MREEVEQFIKLFKGEHPKIIEELFSKDNSYWFARILEEKFGGVVYYLPGLKHFITGIDHTYYDIEGEFLKVSEMPVEYRK